MTTHYHVVLESTRTHLSAGMQWLNGVYAQSFNTRYARRGHLFGSRFGARAIEDEEYLQRVCEYVLLNPVRAGLCEIARNGHGTGPATASRTSEFCPAGAGLPGLLRTLVRSDPPG